MNTKWEIIIRSDECPFAFSDWEMTPAMWKCLKQEGAECLHDTCPLRRR